MNLSGLVHKYLMFYSIKKFVVLHTICTLKTMTQIKLEKKLSPNTFIAHLSLNRLLYPKKIPGFFWSTK